MPQQLFLGPGQGWDLPGETDLVELRARLTRALAVGRGVVEVAVVVDGQPSVLLVNAAAAAAVLVVDVPGPEERRIAH